MTAAEGARAHEVRVGDRLVSYFGCYAEGEVLAVEAVPKAHDLDGRVRITTDAGVWVLWANQRVERVV